MWPSKNLFRICHQALFGTIPAKGVLMLLILALQGCSTGYYFHLAQGQVQLLAKRIATEKVLKDPSTLPPLRERLELTQDLLQFAKRHLKLKVDGQYTSYVELGRPYPLWSLSAAPELSLTPYKWCYPLVGCASYRGFFDLDRARKDERSLTEQGYETSIRGVPAYSTLGWFADPILSSFNKWSDENYIELIFHELAHGKLYVKNDTQFNESFATFVGRKGLEQFRESHQISVSEKHWRSKKDFKELKVLIMTFQAKLKNVFESDRPDAEKRQKKKGIYAQLRQEYESKKHQWQSPNAWDGWIKSLNNAQMLAFSDYEARVPEFQVIFENCNENWDCFYSQSKLLSVQN